MRSAVAVSSPPPRCDDDDLRNTREPRAHAEHERESDALETSGRGFASARSHARGDSRVDAARVPEAHRGHGELRWTWSRARIHGEPHRAVDTDRVPRYRLSLPGDVRAARRARDAL